MKFNLLKVIGGFLAIFGIIMLIMTTSVIFDLFGIRELEGNFVMSVVIANWFAGLLYIVAAYGLFNKQKWSYIPLLISAITLIISFIFLQVHIQDGGAFEEKTIKALSIRIVLSLIFAIIAYFKINKSKSYEK